MPAYGVGRPKSHGEALRTFGETSWVVMVVDVNARIAGNRILVWLLACGRHSLR